MCGITGFAYDRPNRPGEPERLRAMTDTLIHRGPDGEGYHLDLGVGLGIRRLSIIDLETGDQPIANETGDVVVICNGEIYNYVELRQELQARGHRLRSQSDVEVIVHLYEEMGIGCVTRLRGMFGLAIWDRARSALVLARDRFGIKPLHYAQTPDGLFFGSEQKAILASGAVDREMSHRGLRDLLTFGFVVAPATMFDSIRHLEPGTLLEYRDGQASIERYWDARFEPPERIERRSEEAWCEAFREKLEETVRIHMRSDVPVGAWLSPGIDSSAIVALMAQGRTEPIHTTTLAFESEAFDEVRGQRSLLDDPSLPLTRHIATCVTADFASFAQSIWFAEDPTATGLEVPRSRLGEETARGVKVILTGEGSDEILAGYPRFRLNKLMRPLALVPPAFRRIALLGGVLPRRWPRASRMLVAPRKTRMPRYAATLGGPRSVPRGIFLSSEAQASLLAEPPWDLDLPDGFDRWPALSQLQYYEIKLRMPSFVIHTLDRGTMAHSVEARVPFLDHELFELTAKMPPSLKLKGFREKHVLREAVRSLLPEEIVERKKRGMGAPIAEWLRAPLPADARELLSPKHLRQSGLFDPAGVIRLLDQHLRCERNWSTELMAVLGIQVWYELFSGQGGDVLPPGAIRG